MFHPANEQMQAHEKYDQGYYLGTVTANNDPLNGMRIKADVPGLFDTSLGDVPWIGPLKDSPFGFGKGYGTYGVPQVGSTVVIELQGGDEHRPLYRTLPTVPNANPMFAGANVWGFEDPAGNIVIYNLQTKTYAFITASGARVDIDGSGNRTTQVANDTENASGSWTVNVSGNATIKAGGTIDIEAGGTATYKAASHVFQGPVTGDSTIAAAGDISDNTAGGGGTMRNMREVYDTHTHDYDDGVTDVPNQQV